MREFFKIRFACQAGPAKKRFSGKVRRSGRIRPEQKNAKVRDQSLIWNGPADLAGTPRRSANAAYPWKRSRNLGPRPNLQVLRRSQAPSFRRTVRNSATSTGLVR